MNKADLINKVAQVTATKKDAKVAVEAVLSGISGALADGDSVSLIGFGTFKVSQRAARQGRNPRTGENVYIPAKKVPRFVAGKALKDAVK
jgi:nucleoid DNA-binding protein